MEIINFDSVKEVDGFLDEALLSIKESMTNINSSYDLLPSQVKDKMSSYYEQLKGTCVLIEEKINYAKTGIAANVSAYRVYEEEKTSSEVSLANIQESNNFFWGYLSSTGTVPKKLGKDYFAYLASSGVGSLDNTIYSIENNGVIYQYNTVSGKLTTVKNGQKTISYAGFYSPLNVSNLSMCTTITFLPGDGEHYEDGSGFKLDQNEQIKGVLANSTNGLIVLPQCPSGNDGYIRVGDRVVDSTLFAQSFMQQDASVSNSIIGVSSGGISAFNIASNVGSNVYDTVVSVNGYARFSDSLESSALLDKEIIFLASQNDNVMNGKQSVSLKAMYDNGYSNVHVITSSAPLAQESQGYGFTTEYIADDKWKGHASAWYSINQSGIIDYLGGK